MTTREIQTAIVKMAAHDEATNQDSRHMIPAGSKMEVWGNGLGYDWMLNGEAIRSVAYCAGEFLCVHHGADDDYHIVPPSQR